MFSTPLISIILELLLFQSSHVTPLKQFEIKKVLEQPLVTPAPNIVATVLELNFPPGDQGVPAHYHSGPVVGYVIEGKILFQVNDEPPRIIEAGSAFYEKDRDVHVWGANASNTTSCKVVVTIYGRPGEEILTFVKDYDRESYGDALARAQI